MRRSNAATLAALIGLVATQTSAQAEKAPRKRETTAGALSFGVTAGLIATGVCVSMAFGQPNRDPYDTAAGMLIVGGVMLGPSVGHWYAGDSGWNGLAIRGAGATVIIGSIAAGRRWAAGDQDSPAPYLAVALLGVVAIGSSAAYDIATAPRAARRSNARHQVFAPLLGDGRAGLVLTGSF